MRIISIVVFLFTASALALTQVKTRDANQQTQVKREVTSMGEQAKTTFGIKSGSMQNHAKATFGIKSWDEKPYNEIEGAPKLTRAAVTKSYQGDIEGEGKVEYLMMYRADGSATFTGLERVTGSIGGRSGSFVLEHSGFFENGIAKVRLSVVPGSGTGDLKGLKGEGGFNAGHQPPWVLTLDYDFE